MLKEALASFIGFEKINPVFISEGTRYEWNPRKFARNVLLVLGALWAKDAVPQFVAHIDRITSPSTSAPKTALEAYMNGEIRKGNLIGLLAALNQVPPPDILLSELRGPDKQAIEYFFASLYQEGISEQTVYTLRGFTLRNLGAVQISPNRELYLAITSMDVARFKVTGTEVTRINGAIATEYFVVQPYFDDEKNIPKKGQKAKPGDFKVRFLAVGRWDNVSKDVDWGDEEINRIWQGLPTSKTLIPDNIPDLSGITGIPNQVIPPIFPWLGVSGQETWRDRVTQTIKTFKPFHQTEGLPSPREFLDKPKTPGPESSLLRSGAYSGRPGPFANTGLPKSEVLRRQRQGKNFG